MISADIKIERVNKKRVHLEFTHPTLNFIITRVYKKIHYRVNK